MISKRTERARRTRAGDREDRKGEAAEILEQTREAAGLTVADFAAQVGVSETKVHAWEDPDNGGAPPPLDAMLVPSVQAEAVRHLARRIGLVVTELPKAQSAHDEAALIASVHKETTEAVQAALMSLTVGYRTRGTTKNTRRELWEAIEAMVRFDTLLASREDEPVIGIKLVSGGE